MSSRTSLRNVEESLHHVDATFFLGKVGFLITGGKCIPARPPPRVPCAWHRVDSSLRPPRGDGKNVSFRI